MRRRPSVSKFSLMVRGLDRKLNDSDQLRKHFERLFDEHDSSVVAVQLISDRSRLMAALQQLESARDALDRVKTIAEQRRNMGRSAPTIRRLCELWRKEDAVSVYQKQVADREEAVVALSREGSTRNAGVAFISFTSSECVRLCLAHPRAAARGHWGRVAFASNPPGLASTSASRDPLLTRSPDDTSLTLDMQASRFQSTETLGMTGEGGRGRRHSQETLASSPGGGAGRGRGSGTGTAVTDSEREDETGRALDRHNRGRIDSRGGDGRNRNRFSVAVRRLNRQELQRLRGERADGFFSCLCPWRGLNLGWKLRRPPAPSDIVWENVHLTEWQRSFLKWMSNGGLLIVSVLAVAPLTVANNVTVLLMIFLRAGSGEVSSSTEVFLSQLIPPLMLFLFNSLLLPYLVSLKSDTQRWWKTSARETAVVHGNVVFLVLNTLVLPLLALQSLQAFVENYVVRTELSRFRSELSELGQRIGRYFLSQSGAFVIRYVLSSALLSSAAQLLQAPQLCYKSLASLQAVTEKERRQARAQWKFDFGYWYAFHLSILLLVVCFSVAVPLVCPMGVLYFGLKYISDKYNFAHGVWATGASTREQERAKERERRERQYEYQAAGLQGGLWEAEEWHDADGEGGGTAFSLVAAEDGESAPSGGEGGETGERGREGSSRPFDSLLGTNTDGRRASERGMTDGVRITTTNGRPDSAASLSGVSSRGGTTGTGEPQGDGGGSSSSGGVLMSAEPAGAEGRQRESSPRPAVAREGAMETLQQGGDAEASSSSSAVAISGQRETEEGEPTGGTGTNVGGGGRAGVVLDIPPRAETQESSGEAQRRERENEHPHHHHHLVPWDEGKLRLARLSMRYMVMCVGFLLLLMGCFLYAQENRALLYGASVLVLSGAAALFCLALNGLHPLGGDLGRRLSRALAPDGDGATSEDDAMTPEHIPPGFEHVLSQAYAQPADVAVRALLENRAAGGASCQAV